MTSALWAGLLAGYAIAVPVGAVATYLVALAARSPWRVSVAAALGVATTDGLYALVATLGGAVLAGIIAPAAGWLRAVAAVVLLVLAARTVVDGVRAYRAVRPSPVARSADLSLADPSRGRAGGRGVIGDGDGRATDEVDDDVALEGGSEPGRPALRAFVRLLAITAVNPATVLYFATVVVGARAASVGSGGTGAVVGGALFVAGAFVASASWQLLLVGGGSLLGRALSGPRGRLATALVSAAVMGGLVVAMLVL